MIDRLPILGICGWSGSGKTALIERMTPALARKGLAVAVVKHDAHGIDVDRPGKDSDRLFRAGADVLLQGPQQTFFRTHRRTHPPAAPRGRDDRTQAILDLAGRYDLVLVEGHKPADLRKVWLLGEGESAPPPEVTNVAAVLPWDSDRPAKALALAESYLAEQWLKTPLFGCVLIGGKSTRMGAAKHLLQTGGRTWLELTTQLMAQLCRQVVLAGAGDVPGSLAGYPRLADAPGAAGPMSGILAAMRWAPRASWLLAACDLPDLTARALRWLLSTRAPGVWATLPTLPGSGRVQPVLAHYDFRSRLPLERQAARGCFRLAALASDPKTACPPVPPDLAPAWRNVNEPADLEPPTP